MNRLARAAAARGAVSREHAVAHRLAALLLEYPTAELVALLPQVRTAAQELPPHLAEPLVRLTDHLAGGDLGARQAEYVETFDLRRRCSLYLTYYAYGDTRKRGVALVEFKQAYREAGFEVDPEELPDHLCAVLELAATAAEEHRSVGIRLLLDHRAGLELLRLALTDAASPYRWALEAVSATLPALDGDDRHAVARLAAEGPPGEGVGLEPYGPPTDLPRPGRPPVADLPDPAPRPGLHPTGAPR